MWPVGLQIAVLLACADASLTLRPRRIILPGIRLLAARLPSRQTHPHCIRHIFSTAAIAAAESNDQGLPPLQNPSEPLSALERIKRAKAYKRSGGTSEAVNTAASGADEVAEPGFNETDIQEIEKLEGEEMYSSQFSNIKSTIENMETLEERGMKTDQKAYELLKKLGLPSPKPHTATSELEFPSEDFEA